jgi:GR25 family glycosyltransferase involved in LPS biosynthesis
MKIFVAHYSPLKERKEHLLQQFEKQNIQDFEFIEKYNREDLDFCTIDFVGQTSLHDLFDPKLKLSKLSLVLKHFYIYKEIAEKYDEALILEDDVILQDGFLQNLELYKTQLPEDYDMLFIGDGCKLHIPKERLVPDIFIYEKNVNPTSWGGQGCSRCSDSYLVSKKCAKQLCDYIANTTKKNRFSY